MSPKGLYVMRVIGIVLGIFTLCSLIYVQLYKCSLHHLFKEYCSAQRVHSQQPSVWSFSLSAFKNRNLFPIKMKMKNNESREDSKKRTSSTVVPINDDLNNTLNILC
jgi:hypothetical protein